ncbi:MAG: aminopeptidase [Bacteroidales bacterium]|nr:aminopeptidase [Bacteroidales bacterium]MBQ6871891.1 aminopeptidase [Bacteroidales bacterium]MBQ7998353.1 aminopeptidase [Bacteroidales bacterium]MBQ8035319.1 aminopeptidase [Bacteroidales bacterium]
MKKIFLLTAAFVSLVTVLSAQYKYEFTVVKENPATAVKNQARTGTCWCFATISFLESELLRMGKGEHDLSEMYIVRHNYNRRIADNYLRRGKGNVNPGSLSHMCTYAVKHFGLIPEEAYPGINYDSPTHNHTELSNYVKLLSAEAVKNKKRIPAELQEGLFDAFLGKVPETFVYQGKEYTPQSFAASLGLNMDDYVEITSFSHHPFYEQIILEVPDNWDFGKHYNVPLDDMMAIIDNAIEKGYTVAWDGDISEPSYDFNKNSIALNCKDTIKNRELKNRVKELPVTQESRQADFENFTTVDDHLEHITGIAKDQEGVKYYITKNSWGLGRNGTGYHNMSENYVKAKTIGIMVHKNSIPKEIRAKLKIK